MSANYPTNDPTDGSLLIAANNVSTTLNGGISSGAASMTLASSVNFPSAGGVTIESEAILYTGNNTATSVLSGLTRGADSTTAAVHADGTAVWMHMQARHHNQVKDEIIAIGADLRNITKQDLDETQTLSTTAATMKMRLDQISNRIATISNSTDWKSGFHSHFVDVTQGVLSAATSTTANGAYVNTGLQVSLNMQTTTARALIEVHCGFFFADTSTAVSKFTIFRGAQNIFSDVGSYQEQDVRTEPAGTVALRYLDSPATTGSVTYSVNMKCADGAAPTTLSFGNASITSIIHVTLLM